MIAYEGWPSAAGSPPSYDIGDAAERIQALLDAGDRDGAVSVVCELVGLDEDQLQTRAQPRQARLAAATTLPRELRTEPTIQLTTASSRPSECRFCWSSEARTTALRPGADQLSSLMPDARVHILPGRKHMAFDTAPNLLAAAITTFAEATGARPQSLTARRPATQTLKRPLKRAIRHPTSRHGAGPSTVLETPRARRIGRTR